MKQSTIWILTVIMAIVFAGLLYMQIAYIDSIRKMREDQFTEAVRRSLHGVTVRLEQDEARYFLEDDVNAVETSLVFSGTGARGDAGIKYSISTQSGLSANLTIEADVNQLSRLSNTRNDFSEKFNNMQQQYHDKYAYHRSLLNEVILNIMTQATLRPITERADSATVRAYLAEELANNGITIPFEISIVNSDGVPVYSSTGFNSDIADSGNSMFIRNLFPNDAPGHTYYLKVYFPDKGDYILKSLRIVIPAFALTVILFIASIFTIVVAFRQKKVTEMKNDFINNMTHEFKTPISTISLAAQMLNDPAVIKSPAMLQHASTIINDETKRLRFQVEKVLQMSLFDKKKASVKIEDVDANVVIYNIVNTFKMKVERYGGRLTADLDAEDAIVMVDNMHFTNVIYNLLDNAVKYRRDDVPLQLKVTTADIPGDRLRITVEDNGIGIKRDDLKKIFDKFYRVHTGNLHDVKGFGLGLAYVKRMITELGGTITVESVFNQGTKFIIILPLTKN